MILLPRYDDRIESVVLAAGDYPSSPMARGILSNAVKVVCCDGAAAGYCEAGGVPYAIVGDCDSLDDRYAGRYAGIVRRNGDQETNDLTKAVNFCLGQGMADIVILGATGKREDHTIANIALMADYISMPGVSSVRMITDYAVLDAVSPQGSYDPASQAGVAGGGIRGTDRLESALWTDNRPYGEFGFESLPGQQVSIFTPRAGVRVTTQGLRYPLHRAILQGWWAGTLNESEGESFRVEVNGPAIVYRVL